MRSLSVSRALLSGDPADEIIRSRHLLPSLVADAVNEALFDEIGDTVLLCEDGKLLLVEDYTDELKELLGGT